MNIGMSFKDFMLVERLASLVHVNDSNTLSVIANLVQQDFGVENPRQVGVCLYSQFLFTVESVTGIPIPVLQKFYSIKNKRDNGHTPAELIDHFNTNKLTYNGKKYKLRVHMEEYNITEAIAQVKKGQPVVVIVRGTGEFFFNLRDSRWRYSDPEHPGQVSGKPASLTDETGEHIHRNSFHALLMIGFDSGHNFVIFRDSRSSYAYKGYFRVKLDLIKKNQASFKIFGFVVDSFDEVK